MKIKLRKKLGQHFLKNNKILRILANSLPDIHNNLVIEIGGGMGNLTRFLTSAKKLVVYELDYLLSLILENKFSDYKNVKIINKDFLKADLSKFKNNFLLIGNIPYSITGKIIRKIFQKNNHPKIAVMTVQREYGEKILGKYGNNFLHSWIKNFAEIKKIIYINKKNFVPVPRVDSLAIKFIFYQQPLVENLNLFEELLKNLFKFSNRTLLNNLKFWKEDIILKIDSETLKLRARQLSFEKVVNLFNLIEKR